MEVSKMFMKLFILLCFASITIKACGFDYIIEDIYDYDDEEDDNSSEKPDNSSSLISPKPSNKPAPSNNNSDTNKPSNNDKEDNSNEKPDNSSSSNSKPAPTPEKPTPSSRQADRPHQVVKHHRRRLIRRVPAKNVGSKNEEINEDRVLYDNYQYPSRYAPDAAPVVKHNVRGKFGREYVVAPVSVEDSHIRKLSVGRIGVNNQDNVNENQHQSNNRLRLVRGADRKFYWINVPEEAKVDDYHTDSIEARKFVVVNSEEEKINRNVQGQYIQLPEIIPTGRIEIPNENNRHDQGRFKIIENGNGKFILIDRADAENAKKEDEEESKNNPSEIEESLTFIGLRPFTREDDIKRKHHKQEREEQEDQDWSKIVILVPNQNPDVRNRESEEDGDHEERKHQKVVNLIIGKNQQTYLINPRTNNDKIVVNNGQIEVPLDDDRDSTPRRSSNIKIPILLNINNDYDPNIYKLLDEKRNPNVNQIDHIKERLTTKYIKHYPDDNSDIQNIYELSRSSYIKNLYDSIKDDKVPESADVPDDFKQQDHSLAVQQLPDISSSIHFNQGFDKATETPTVQPLPLVHNEQGFNENSFALKPFDVRLSDNNQGHKVSVNTYYIPHGQPTNYPAATPPPNKGNYYVPPHHVNRNPQNQPQHSVQHIFNQLPYQKVPLVDLINRFNEKDADNSESEHSQGQDHSAKNETSTATPTSTTNKTVDAV